MGTCLLHVGSDWRQRWRSRGALGGGGTRFSSCCRPLRASHNPRPVAGPPPSTGCGPRAGCQAWRRARSGAGGRSSPAGPRSSGRPDDQPVNDKFKQHMVKTCRENATRSGRRQCRGARAGRCGDVTLAPPRPCQRARHRRTSLLSERSGSVSSAPMIEPPSQLRMFSGNCTLTNEKSSLTLVWQLCLSALTSVMACDVSPMLILAWCPQARPCRPRLV